MFCANFSLKNKTLQYNSQNPAETLNSSKDDNYFYL